MTTAIKSLEGIVAAAGLGQAGSTASFLPRRKNERPHARYGKRGIYVVLAPVKGLTPNGVFRNNKPFAFQCPPMNEFGEGGGYNHQDYQTVGAGEHTSSVGRQLRTCQFDTIFMDSEPEFALAHDGSGRYPAQRALKDLCAIRDHGKPFHLIVHQSNFQGGYEIDYAATLRSVSWHVSEPDAYYVTVAFTEFSTPDIQEFLAGSNVNPKLPASLPVKNLPSNRNTMAKMAKFYYGDPSKWRVIAAKNGLTNVAMNTTIRPEITARVRVTVPVLKQTRKSTGQHR